MKNSPAINWNTWTPEGAEHSQFKIGTEFYSCDTHRWRCTDIGSRVIVAIRIDEHKDKTWYDGPPYAVAETVFDEYSRQGVTLVKI